ncbi:MAG: hypothetical protein R2932_45415 [Caldilineaceae bacterium]
MRKQTPTIEWTVTESDALYLTLAHNLGLSLIPMPEKLYTAVSMIQRPGLTPIHYHPVQSISVPSPALYRAPGTLTDTEVLAQSLMLPLFDDLLARAKVQYAIRPIWQPLLSGLRLWQLWDLDLPLSIWRTAMVQWAYADLPGSTAEQFATLQLPYAEICAAHQLWLRYPAQIHIPCGAVTQISRLSRLYHTPHHDS